MDDRERVALLSKELEKTGDWVDPLDQMREPAPDWRRWPPAALLQYLRGRLLWSQVELGRRAGLTQAQISKLEGGADAQLSTWQRVFAAMGFSLGLAPRTAMTTNELKDRAEQACQPHRRYRQRARPRRKIMP